MNRKLFWGSSLWILLWIISACAVPPTPLSTPTELNFNQTNPASAFCLKQGGQLVLRRDSANNVYGVCIFEDNTECDEWAYFRHECGPGDFAVAPTPVQHPTYVNKTYGFSFDPPLDWTVEEGDHLVRFHHEGLLLSVAYQWTEEDQPINRGNVPAGEYEEAFPANLLGQPLPKRLLICGEEIKQVEYAPGLRIDQLRLIIWIEPEDIQETTEKEADLNVNEEDFRDAESIITSFALLSGETPRLVIEDVR